MHRTFKPAVFVAALVFLATRAASAAECDDIAREDLLHECLARELSIADHELNATYTRLRAGMSKDARELLIKAQKLWIALRDVDCDLEAEAYKGGTAYQAIYLQCGIDKTRQRTSEFKKSRFWPRE
jgi:uncharacterized protein YecT (DUF1311 family)